LPAQGFIVLAQHGSKCEKFLPAKLGDKSLLQDATEHHASPGARPYALAGTERGGSLVAQRLANLAAHAGRTGQRAAPLIEIEEHDGHRWGGGIALASELEIALAGFVAPSPINPISGRSGRVCKPANLFDEPRCGGLQTRREQRESLALVTIGFES
jgi:hypothetical protein